LKPILVIADDLTGAAEIGGIATAHGLSAIIHRGQFLKTPADVVILDTDSRLLPPPAGAHRIQSILSSVNPSAFRLIYKKTDSMLRGPVAAELLAALESLHFPRALFVPQNPSRNRIIENGHYLIDRIPLHNSPVAIDLENPPPTSEVCRLLDPAQDFDLQCLPPGQPPLPRGITIGAAANASEIRHWSTQQDSQTLFAGGADFFAALLESLGLHPNPAEPFAPPTSAIVIFGSASNPSRDFVTKLAASGAVICDLPFAPSNALLQLRTTGYAFIAARSPVSSTRADQIRAAIADLIPPILSGIPVKTLIIEGGATASAVIDRQGWTTLQVKSTVAPGVVTLLPDGQTPPLLILKPGTYPWPPTLATAFTQRLRKAP
jgi:D-threonate/D-erythronate kinase